MSTIFSRLHGLRVLETHQLPGTFSRLLGDALLVIVGLLAWAALPLAEPGHFAIAAAGLSLGVAGFLLASGRNARLVRWDARVDA